MRNVKQGLNIYCAPAVLSILTGRSVDECASVIGSFSGQYEVREARMGDIIKAAKKLRVDLQMVTTTENSSLYYTLFLLNDKPGLYLVSLPKHVVAIEVTEDRKVFFCDNHTKEPIDARVSARLGQKCLGAYLAKQMPDPVLLEVRYDIDLKYGLRINKISMFENPEDNITQYIGNINAEPSELLNILHAALDKLGVKSELERKIAEYKHVLGRELA